MKRDDVSFLGRIVGGIGGVVFPLAAFAQQTAEGGPSRWELFLQMLPMLGMVMVVFYFFILKPQQAREREKEDLFKNLKKGDQVTTTGGIIGKVFQIEEDAVFLEVAANVRIKVERSHIVKRV